jgi:hypothetical protein
VLDPTMPLSRFGECTDPGLDQMLADVAIHILGN